jgi:alkylhydroperoxidase family enzyme
MVRIRIVRESEAQGETRELYDEAREAFGVGFVPDVLKLVSRRPAFLRKMLDSYRAMFLSGVLPRDVKEALATTVSVTNSCHY